MNHPMIHVHYRVPSRASIVSHIDYAACALRGDNIKYCDCRCQSGGDKTSRCSVSLSVRPTIGMVAVDTPAAV